MLFHLLGDQAQRTKITIQPASQEMRRDYGLDPQDSSCHTRSTTSELGRLYDLGNWPNSGSLLFSVAHSNYKVDDAFVLVLISLVCSFISSYFSTALLLSSPRRFRQAAKTHFHHQRQRPQLPPPRPPLRQPHHFPHHTLVLFPLLPRDAFRCRISKCR